MAKLKKQELVGSTQSMEKFTTEEGKALIVYWLKIHLKVIFFYFYFFYLYTQQYF